MFGVIDAPQLFSQMVLLIEKESRMRLRTSRFRKSRGGCSDLLFRESRPGVQVESGEQKIVRVAVALVARLLHPLVSLFLVALEGERHRPRLGGDLWVVNRGSVVNRVSVDRSEAFGDS